MESLESNAIWRAASNRWTLMPGGGNNVAQCTEHDKHTQETRMKHSHRGEMASQSSQTSKVSGILGLEDKSRMAAVHSFIA